MSRIWVVDTCALLEVRRCVTAPDDKQKQGERRRVFAALDELAQEGRLVFPPETHAELKAGATKLPASVEDHAFSFVDSCKKVAQRAANWDVVKEMVADDLVRRVVDPNAEKDEADVYVLSVAMELQREGNEVGVLTQERKDTPTKLSMATACGLLGLVCLPMQPFLHREGIWNWR